MYNDIVFCVFENNKERFYEPKSFKFRIVTFNLRNIGEN